MTFKSNGKKKNRNGKSKEKISTPQDDFDSLQITFYEIESWIEKTCPILTRMTKELDKASTHFHKKPTPAITNWIDTTLPMNTMQWRMSFQPGNLLRVDTDITSIEQLIKAVQLLQAPSLSPSSTEEEESEQEQALISTSSVEYWQYALGRRPKIHLDTYKYNDINLNYLTKDISPSTLDSIGQVYWDCLHPKFSSDWNSFSGNQACIDSGLAMMFLHVIRHDKDICTNSQNIAVYYYDRARDQLSQFFDKEPDFSTAETLLNLSMFCIVCKQLSQARIYISLCLQIVIECGFLNNLPTNDLMLRKQYLKLILILYYNDWTLSVYKGEAPLISDEDFDIDFYEIITLNKELKHQMDSKTIVKETYFVHVVELVRLTKRITLLIQQGAAVKQLVAEEKKLEEWYDGLPATLRNLDYGFQAQREDRDTDSLQAQASLLLKIQYESLWIILHKGISHSRSNAICLHSADTIIRISEIITQCFGWCVCQQIIICLYHASTVYCRQIKDDLETREQAKAMIHRIMRVLEAGSLMYQGFPDDMTECLDEFLKMHNDKK